MLYKYHAPAGPVIVGARERDESDHARLSAILEKFLTSKITLCVDGSITMASSLEDRLNASCSLLEEVNTTRGWGSENMSPLQREFTAFKESQRKRLQAQAMVSSAQATSEVCRLWRELQEERRKVAGMHAESNATMHETPDAGVAGEQARRRDDRGRAVCNVNFAQERIAATQAGVEAFEVTLKALVEGGEVAFWGLGPDC